MPKTAKNILLAFMTILGLILASPNASMAASKAAVTMVSGTVSVSGVRAFAQTLTAVPADWTAPSVSFKYQWLRNGANIAGATRSTYTLTAKDVDGGWSPDETTPTRNITVKLTASAPGYKVATATSASVNAANGKPCTLIGTSERDIMYGTTGVDVLCGLAGDDVFAYSKGADVIDGGLGSDGFDMSDEKANATVVLPNSGAAGTASVLGGKVSSLLSVENVQTGRGADHVDGSDGSNRIVTYPLDAATDGNDFVSSGAGDDYIFTGRGDDYITSGAGDDSIIAGEGDDTIFGGGDFNYCDEPDSYDDNLDHCQTDNHPAVLLDVIAPAHGVGHYEFVVGDPFSSVLSVFVSMDNPDGTPSFGEGDEAYFISREGYTSTWGFDFDLQGMPPSVLAEGHYGLRITTSTIDDRNSELVGQSDGSWLGYTSEYEGDPNPSQFWADSNIGPTYVVFNWDTQAPAITEFRLSATSVDTSTSAQTLTTHITATDDQSTHFTATCSLVVFDSALHLEPIMGGVDFNGSGDCSFDLPVGLPPMTYGVSVAISDELGNRFELNPTRNHKYSTVASRAGSLFGVDLYAPVTVENLDYGQAIAAEFTQSGAGDSIAPDLSSISWSMNSIGTSTSATVVRATLTYTGINGTGSQVFCRLKSPSAKSPVIPAQIVNPAANGNVWVANFTIPKKAPKGKYLLFCAAQDQTKWTTTFQGLADGTFATTGVNATNPATNPGVPYLVVE